jgi:hypothetical protein
MLGYYITASICLGLLVMMPIWSARTDTPSYPFVVILLLALIVFVVPMVLRRRKREGAAVAGELPVRIENRD